MIFESADLCFNLLDVIEIEQKDVTIFNTGRNFDALSFRFSADTIMTTETSSISLMDNSVSFVPARVDYTRRCRRDHFIVIHFNSLNYFSKEIEAITPKNPQKLALLFKEILECWKNRQIGYRHRACALLYRIFEELYIASYKQSEDDSIISDSIKYINKNYLSPTVSVKEAAEKSSVSEVYFRRLFKEKYGVSPKKHIINLRIRRATSLMESGYHSLSEIAVMCGFNDYKYFSTEFRKITGVPPSKYRYKFDK